MNFFKVAAIAVVVVWLQQATLPTIRPFGVVPNLVLVVVVLLASRLPLPTSLGLAVTVGWLLDSSSGSDYGLRTSFYVLLTLATAILRQIGSDLDNLSLQASLVVAATVLLNVAILVNLALLHVNLPLRIIALKLTAEIGCNLVLLLPTKWVLSRLFGQNHEIVVGIGGRRG